ncbi:HEL119Cp [Eremothecium sinecaudum]|uniref:HEL119Cp n=1 Tax=Eremothecium sinecaudum TaxID=45286 RepID=A0A0X8HSR1_9SACH|nr:HEL119Cp [Eremothecium sinecaudum]AMD21161.1 HEL119Cp [Eremothecium sinecaudum]
MLKVGDRVETKNGIGTVRFIGRTNFGDGEWIGIELEEPTGKNNGSIQGVSYFTTNKKDGLYGMFTRAASVKLLPLVSKNNLKGPRKPSSSSEGDAPQRVSSRESRRADSGSRISKLNSAKPRSREVSANNIDTGDREETRSPRSATSPFASATAEEVKLRKIIDTLQKKLFNLRSECSSLQVMLAERSQLENVDMLMKDVEQLTITKETLEGEKEKLQEKILTLETTNNDISLQLAHFKEEVELRRKIDLEEAKRGELNADILWKQNELLKDALVKIQNSLNESNEEAEKLKEEREELLLSNIAFVEQVTSLKQQLQQAQLTVDELAAQIDAEASASTIIDTLTTQNYTLSEEIEVLKGQYTEMSKKVELHNELELVYKEVERELTEQINSLQSKVAGDEVLISKLSQKNRELEIELREGDEQVQTNEAINVIKNHVSILENDKESLKMTVGFLNERLKAMKPDPLLEYHYLLLYLIVQIGKQSEVYEKKSSISNRISLIFLCYTCHVVWRLHSQMLIDGEAVEFITNTIPLYSWINRCQNKQTLNVGEVSSWLMVLDSHPKLDVSANLLYEILPSLCDDVLPSLLSLVRGTLPAEDIQNLYASFQRLEKLSKKFVDDNGLCSKLYTFKNLKVKPFIIKITEIAVRIMDGEATEDVIELCDEVQRVLENSEVEVIQIKAVAETNNVSTFSREASASVEPAEVTQGYEEALRKKIAIIEELTLKVKVLDAKNERFEQFEDKVMDLTSRLEKLKERNNELTNNLTSLQETNRLLEKQIQSERIERYTLVSSKEYSDLLDEKLKLEKMDLIAEIGDLRRFVKSKIGDQEVYDFSWLTNFGEEKQREQFTIQQKGGSLLNMLYEAVDKSDLLPLRKVSGKAQWQPKNKISKYYVSMLQEKEMQIMDMIANFSNSII